MDDGGLPYYKLPWSLWLRGAKKLLKQDSDACNKLDAFGFTKQTATDADLT